MGTRKLNLIHSAIIILLNMYCISCSEKSLNKSIKTILLWNSYFMLKDHGFGTGSAPFVTHKCKVTQCYVTFQRERQPLREFDAIVVNGAHMNGLNAQMLPQVRWPNQTLVYFNHRSPSYTTVFRSMQRMFNLTMTYRLDSDIVFPFFHFVDTNSRVVSHSINTKWLKPTVTTSVEAGKIYEYKTSIVAWFVSQCHTRGRRETYVKQMMRFIKVDIYGMCGTMFCSPSDKEHCDELIKNDYFFYLAFENSHCVDYISEKVLIAYENSAVPIVYGGADLSMFLPPNSYIDAKLYNPKSLAIHLFTVMNDRQEYMNYFWWKDFYRVVRPVPPYCTLCEMLHDPNRVPKLYNNLRGWWIGSRDNSTCSNGALVNTLEF